jgi:hypothetical protein
VAPALAQQTSFWSNSGTTPGTPEVTDDTASVTLGLKFYSDVPGSVTAVRFYKGPHNIGKHVGNLWSSTGTKLAAVTFSGETASGWQQVNFSSPISIAANTTYVISYLASKGYYADDQYYSWSAVNAAPLHVSGSSPGLYAYGSGTFPNGAWNSSNYFVDLVFVPAGPASTYSISGKVSGAVAALTLSGTASGATTTDAAGNYSFSGLKNGSYLVAPSQSGYTFTPSTASESLNGSNIVGVNFTATAVPSSGTGGGGGGSTSGVSHSVSLSWTASASPNITGCKVYRAPVSGGPYVLIDASLVTGSSYVDSSVSSGQTYFYVTTAVDANNVESQYSNEAVAVVPNP